MWWYISLTARCIAVMFICSSVSFAGVTHTIKLDASRSGWVDTGIPLSGGNVLTITADGSVVDWRSPDGKETHRVDPYGRAGTDYLAPGCAPLGLVGKVGGQVFAVGESCTILPLESGELHLAMNETNAGGWADNSGSWNVEISFKRPVRNRATDEYETVSYTEHFSLNASKPGWRPTGIQITHYMLYRFRATGSVVDWRSPDGTRSHTVEPNGRCGRDFLVPGTAPLSLVAWNRSGESHALGPFAVGKERRWMTHAKGTLCLAINETTRGGWADNSGHWTVKVTVE